uniref:Ovule protein n=1 Tax=Panagrellus redivivus TaxID=6233 RepID=A0A7E4VW60_PANRE
MVQHHNSPTVTAVNCFESHRSPLVVYTSTENSFIKNSPVTSTATLNFCLLKFKAAVAHTKLSSPSVVAL